MAEKIKAGSEIICEGCGAMLTSAVCPYCGRMNVEHASDVYRDYPMLACKETYIHVARLFVGGITTVTFLPLSLFMIMAAIGHRVDTENILAVITIAIGFMIPPIVCLVMIGREVWPYIVVKIKGKRVTGVVCAYEKGRQIRRGMLTQDCLILVETEFGTRLIRYNLESDTHPFGINETVWLKMYKEHFLLEGVKVLINSFVMS